MTGKPYTDADVDQLHEAFAKAWTLHLGQHPGTGCHPEMNTEDCCDRHGLRAVLDALAAAGRLRPATTDDQVRAGADALVRLRTAAPGLSELDKEEQAFWLRDAAAVLEAAGPVGPVDDDPRHIIEFRPDGWTIKHPLSCRIGDLFGCSVNLAAEDLDGPPAPLGRYETSVSDIDGRLQIGDRVDQEVGRHG